MRHKTAIINNFTAHNKLKFFNNSKLFGKCNKTFSKGDGGVGTFDVRGGGPCPHFWFKSSNLLDARLNRVRNSYNKIKLNFNDL